MGHKSVTMAPGKELRKQPYPITYAFSNTHGSAYYDYSPIIPSRQGHDFEHQTGNGLVGSATATLATSATLST